MIQAVLFAMLAGDFAPAIPAVPNRQPQLASSGRTVAMTYGAGSSVLLRVSRDSGSTFGPEETVATGGKLSLGMRRGPRVAVSGGSIVVAAVVGARGGGADGDVVAWFKSKDFIPTTLNSVPGSAREGLHALAANDSGLMAAAWLDLRQKGMRIYGAISRNGGQNWEPDRLWYESPSGSVCECCHINLAIAPDGEIFLMFRNSVEGARDMYLARSKNGVSWTTKKIGQGTWILNACPMDGGDLKLDAKGEPQIVWRREKQVYSGGLNGTSEKLVGAGKNAVVSMGKQPVILWSSSDGLRAGAELLDPKGAYASSVRLSDGSSLAAWESEGVIKTRRIP